MRLPLDEPGLAEAARLLRAGRCVGLPTDTVYGIAARLDDDAAVAALFDVKGRAATKAIAVLVASTEMAGQLGHLGPLGERLAAAHWPGGLTLVVDRAAGLDADLGGDPTSIGLRCPDLGPLRALMERVGPLVTTSANRTGEPTATTAGAVEAVFGGALAAVVDGGTLSGLASTVVDVRGGELVVLREGALSAAELARLS